MHLTASQARLTAASRTLRHHLQAQVPNARDYALRDKTMRMRFEAPATVALFLAFLERGAYDAGAADDAAAVRTHLCLCAFAEKYEVRALGAYARARAGAALERLVSRADEDTADSRGGGRAWARVAGQVLGGIEGAERTAVRDVLERLVRPFVWRAGGDVW